MINQNTYHGKKFNLIKTQPYAQLLKEINRYTMTKYTRTKFDDEHKKKVESYKVATCGSEVEPLLE